MTTPKPGPGPAKRASDPTAADPNQRAGLDPGAFVGHEPEREAETIPGGIGPKDQRISAVATQPGVKSADEPPAGHRDAGGPGADTHENLREAGQNR